MKSKEAAKRCVTALLCAAAYYAAFRFVQWIVGKLGVEAIRAMLSAGWLDGVSLSLLDHVLTLVIHAVTFSGLFVWMRFRNRRVLTEVGCRPMEVVPMAAAVLGGVGANFTVSWLFEVIPFPETWTTNYAESAERVFVDYSWVTVVMTVIVAPLTEELLFRGLVYTRLRRGMPRALAAVLSALLFGVAHGDLLWAMYAFAIGLLFVWIFETTGSLWSTVLCHMSFNAVGQLSLGGITAPVRPGIYLLGTVVLAASMTVLALRAKREE